MSKYGASPTPITKSPIGMAYRSKFAPSSPISQPRNKGLGLFLSQRDKHTDDEEEIIVTENMSPSIMSNGVMRGGVAPLNRSLSSPGTPKPVATPFAGLQIKTKSKPIKMVRLKGWLY